MSLRRAAFGSTTTQWGRRGPTRRCARRSPNRWHPSTSSADAMSPVEVNPMVVHPADLLHRVLDTGGDQDRTEIGLKRGLRHPGRPVGGPHGRKGRHGEHEGSDRCGQSGRGRPIEVGDHRRLPVLPGPASPVIPANTPSSTDAHYDARFEDRYDCLRLTIPRDCKNQLMLAHVSIQCANLRGERRLL